MAEGIRKRFGDRLVLCGVDLGVQAGSVLALLGPNGAGKTTMVRILSTLTSLDDGRVRVAGFDVTTQPREVRRRISLVGQHASLDEMLTGRENLDMLALLGGLSQKQAQSRRRE